MESHIGLLVQRGVFLSLCLSPVACAFSFSLSLLLPLQLCSSAARRVQEHQKAHKTQHGRHAPAPTLHSSTSFPECSPPVWKALSCPVDGPPVRPWSAGRRRPARGPEQKVGSTAFCADSGPRFTLRSASAETPCVLSTGSSFSAGGWVPVICPPDRKLSSPARVCLKLKAGPLLLSASPSSSFFFFFLQQNPSGQSPTWSLWGASGFRGSVSCFLELSSPRCAGFPSCLCPQGFSVSPTLPHDGTDPHLYGSLCLPSPTGTPLHDAWMDGSGGGARKALASASQRGNSVPSTLQNADDHSRPVSSHRNGVLGRLFS